MGLVLWEDGVWEGVETYWCAFVWELVVHGFDLWVLVMNVVMCGWLNWLDVQCIYEMLVVLCDVYSVLIA